MAAVFASYPGAVADPGSAVTLSRPLWFGKRHRFSQWQVSTAAIAGWGSESGSAHLAIALVPRLNLYLGRVFGLELGVGPTIVAQVGSPSAIGGGLLASGGYVFRFWDDDRRRLKLTLTMQVAAYAARDPDNDCAANASAFGVGLAYETPY